MNTRSQIMCAWGGILSPLIMFAGLWPAAGFFPPHLPTASAAEIAAIYQQNQGDIRFGMILILIAATLYLPFTAAIAAQMWRIEPRATPVLTCTLFAAGVLNCVLAIIPAPIWSVAAFRPERNPDVTQALNDLGWFFFVWPPVPVLTQGVALGFAIFADTNQRPVYPRWLGFFSFWVALLLVPGCFCTFFKVGPFAWNGLLAFWVPACAYSLWVIVVAIYTIKAASQQAAEAG